ncbi:hypothetical protein PAXINDRAFT_87366, partial [Paxillus involutus ATCC 200175]
MKVSRDREVQTISISQESYIDAILTKYNFANAKPVSIPMDPNVQLLKMQSPKTTTDAAKMKQVLFRAALGSLMYLA